MYRIAVIDVDGNWCFTIKSLFKKSFEVTIFERVPCLLQELFSYDLVMIYHSILPTDSGDNIQGCEIVQCLKKQVFNPPILVLISEFVEGNCLNITRSTCPEADAFFTKGMELDELLNQTQNLIKTKKQKKLESWNHPFIPTVKPMNTIAVVDDDIHWCFTIERFFKNKFEVYRFPTASEFLKQSFDFDLVIVDYSIPHVTNETYIESIELIRYLKNLRYPPLIILASGYVSKNDSALGKKISPEVDAFFAKDSGLDELAYTIKQLLTCDSN
ncbi:MAG TPA: response regulator [Waterburya sp.]|jgi:DNA-binding response OmpR family regulator